MATQWYRLVDGKKDGPFSAGELSAMAEIGALEVDDLVWRDGLKDWVPARKVQGLFDGKPSMPPATKSKRSVPVSPPVAVKPALGVMSAAGLIIVFVCAGGLLFLYLSPEFNTRTMRSIQQQVAEDAVQQYEIAKRNGSAIDAYVQAGFVAAAYLQAQDEANYQRWKAIEREEARRAGIRPP